ncbi:HutD family protein [Celerinatantimonas sp. MCCC 1A17872]|uniref:HutD/Ves family protein n=1 Tax=Celerinatantimonas sp. MCCC 1A17872 TaxID=3177514 RepID=UPI0038C2DD2E
MLKHTIIRQTDFLKVPWKNGQGYTYEIDKLTQPDNHDEFLWRLSIAEVNKSGPFSRFDNYLRNISILSGDSMTLNVDGNDSPELKAFEAFAFTGKADTYCTLHGSALRDFNVIYDPRYAVTVSWLEGEHLDMALDEGTLYFIIAANAPIQVQNDELNTQLECWDLVKLIPAEKSNIQITALQPSQPCICGIIAITPSK